MRVLWITAVLLILGAAAPAQEADEGAAEGTFRIREIELGVQGPETDTSSSRFREYRAVPSGFILPSLRFAGNEGFRYDVQVESALQADARYRVELEPGAFGIAFDFQRIPHRFGNDGRTLHEERPRSVFVMSDTLQRANQSAIESQFAANK